MMKKILFALLWVVVLTISTNAAFEKVNTYNSNFSDVKDTNWFAENVKTAYELGFMNGKDEGRFDPDGNVTIAEGVTMAARLNAIYNGVDIENYSNEAGILRFDFDNLDNISFNYFDGKIENGILVGNSKPRSNGVHDPGIYMNNLELDSRNYNKMVVRMKRDALENPNGAARSETVEVFFSHDAVVLAEKCVKVKLTASPLEDWFEFEVDFSTHPLWKDKITRVRFDPTNNNGVYYIDYIYFTKGAESSAQKWYYKYVDYAVEKGIITGTTYKEEDYSKNISRAELCNLFAAALPESYFNKINDVKAIPDLDKNNEYADILLMLYRAGVVLGSDTEGNFNAYSDIKRSEVAAIINRVALPENRVKGSISAVWDNPDYASDVEFDDPSMLDSFPVEAESAEIKDGTFILIAKDRGENSTGLRYDPKITLSNLSFKAEDYPVMRVRMKAEFIGELATNTKCDIYYMHEEDETFSEIDSYHPDLYEKSYVDAAGWTVFEINMSKGRNWKGNIKALRFDPTNNNGIFTIDYIRFVRSEATRVVTDAELAANYTERRIFPMDEMLENGAYVVTPGDRIAQTSTNAVEGIWSYNDNGKEPIWRLMPLWTDTCLIKNRDTTTDKYTIADTDGNKLVAYDPADKSMRLRLDATKIYKGEPTLKSDKWTHLIFEYDPYDDDYRKVPEDKKAFLDLAADKVYLEMEVKLNDYIVSYQEKEGGLNLSSLLFFMYFAHKDIPNFHTYFGLIPFTKDGPYDRTDFNWFNDSHSQQKIYQVSPQFLYGGDIADSFWRPDGNHLTGEWKHIRVDITPHIENLIRVINEDNAYGNKVSVEDFWISGFNAGYEIRGGNMLDMTFKNFQLICYDKK